MKGIHFRADWLDVVFIHFRMAPHVLAGRIPFELDLREGDAFISLVAFTMAEMRLNVLPEMSRALLRPISGHELLNVRTYVRNRDTRGIYFLAEWLNRPLAVPLGGVSFGLPYRLGKIDYRNGGLVRLGGHVRAGSKSLSFLGQSDAAEVTDASLLERYVAFTVWRGWRRFFEIEHAPWEAKPASIRVLEHSLLEETGRWFDEAEPAGAHYSAGVRDVSMGFPHLLP